MKKNVLFFMAILLVSSFGFAQDKTSKADPNAKNVKAQTFVLKGEVVDEKNQPIPNVNIHWLLTKIYAKTDADGKFSMQVTNTKIELQFSSVGYQPRKIVVTDVLKPLKVQLNPTTESLDNVVIRTGVTEVKKETFTGATNNFSGAKIKQIGNQNVLQSLKTLDPSFVVVSNSLQGANPNSMPVIEVRGKTSISQNQLSNQFGQDPNQPLFILDGFETTLQTVVDLDINRIQSVTILKDASSTALYGARAANGVVVIETIRPKAGKLQLSYVWDSRLEMADLSDYNLMNAAEKLEFERLAGLYKSSIPEKQVVRDSIYNSILANVRRGVNTYWLSEPVQLGVTNNHTINASGGTSEFRYNLGLNLRNQDGVMKGSGRKGWGFNIDLNYRKDQFNITNKTFISGTDATDSPYGSFSNFARANPYFTKYREDGSLAKYLGGVDDPYLPLNSPLNPYMSNPLYNASLNSYSLNNNFSLLNNLQAIYQILPELRWQTSFQFSKTFVKATSFLDPQNTSFDDKSYELKGRYSEDNTQNSQWQLNSMITYAKLFNDAHQVNVSLRAEISENSTAMTGFTTYGFPFGVPGNPNFSFGYRENDRPMSASNIFRRTSALFSTNYAYKNKYIADFTYRIDGSTAFGSNERYAPFWGVGIGWNLHNEFNMNADKVSMFKVRSSLGYTGNQNFGSFASTDVYGYINGNNIFGQGLELKMLANPNLKWQKTKDLSAGIDLAMYKNRFTMTLNGFQKTTDPLVVNVGLPSSTGISSYPMNTGTLVSKGWETMIRFSPIYDLENNIVLNFGLTAASVKSTFKNFDAAIESLNRENLASKNLSRFKDGYSPDDLWAVRSAGIDPATGNEVFIKKDGTQTFTYDPEDIVRVGNSRPTIEGVFSTNFTYKEFSVGLNVRYQFGGQNFNTAIYDKIENTSSIKGSKYFIYNNLDRRALYERWQKPGDIAKYKSIEENSQTPISSRFVQDNNLISGESISFGYTVTNSNHLLLKKTGFSSIRFNVYLNDIFRISSIRAERGIEYPFARTVSFSTNVSF